jgi:hypothetical protein
LTLIYVRAMVLAKHKPERHRVRMELAVEVAVAVAELVRQILSDFSSGTTPDVTALAPWSIGTLTAPPAAPPHEGRLARRTRRTLAPLVHVGAVQRVIVASAHLRRPSRHRQTPAERPPGLRIEVQAPLEAIPQLAEQLAREMRRCGGLANLTYLEAQFGRVEIIFVGETVSATPEAGVELRRM